MKLATTVMRINPSRRIIYEQRDGHEGLDRPSLTCVESTPRPRSSLPFVGSGIKKIMRMKIQPRIVTLLLFATFAFCAYEYLRRPPLPSLRMANPVINLGIVHVGEIHYRSFEIDNNGIRDITITGDTTPCPGVFEQRDPIVIAKGARGRVTVGLIVRDKAMDDIPHTYRYTVKTNDPATPKMELQLIARCKPD